MAERLLRSAPESFALVGFSMGGFVLAEVALLAPERLRALGFVSTTPCPDTPVQTASRRELLGLVRSNRFDELTDIVFPELVGAPMAELWSRMARQVGPEVFARQAEAIIEREDRTQALEGITCPAAVVHGVDDRVVPLERGEAFAASIPHPEMTLIPGGSHFVVRDQPVPVASALSALLAQAEPSRP